MRISDWSSDVCSSDLLIIMAIFVEDIPHRRAFGPAALVVLPHPFIGAVVEIKEFQILELARRGAEQLLAQLDERVHRPADVEEQQQLDRVAPLRAHADVEPALPREIGRAHVCTPVTNAHLVCRLLLEIKKYT